MLVSKFIYNVLKYDFVFVLKNELFMFFLLLIFFRYVSICLSSLGFDAQVYYIDNKLAIIIINNFCNAELRFYK